ncbi:hypothetical protein GWK47_040552 [Chionoecetes opilio]|uniref:Uncharacterized protein n=1 Tax=Chionoecetes opilio TaxID=41210 RepID=A0A8J5CL49_CHIOP|nr:hypothetical protein GWK47_040552 [Chionoecetes opilio]
MVQLTIIVFGGVRLRRTSGSGRLPPVLDGWEKGIYTLKITLFREEFCAHQAREEGADPVHDVYRHNVRGTGDVRPLLDLGPRERGLALLKALAAYRGQGDRAGIGQGDGPAHVVRLRGARRPLPLRRGDGGRGEAGALVSAMQQRWGRRTRLAAPTFALDAVEQRSPASFATTPNLSASSPPSGPVTISSTSIRPSGRGGTTTPRLVGAPVTYGWFNDFAERGVASSARSAAPSRAKEEQRQHLLQVVERHPGVVSVREIGKDGAHGGFRFFLSRHQCRLVEV